MALAGWLLMLLPALLHAGPPAHSGYLGSTSVYDGLEEVEIRPGERAWRWIGPEFSAIYYDAVLVEDVVFYPDAVPGPRVSADTLREVKAYVSARMRREVGSVTHLANAPGPGVLRMQIAITGVHAARAAKEELAVESLFSGGQASEPVRVFFEARFHDSQSGHIVGRAMRELTDGALATVPGELRLTDLTSSLDRLCIDAGASVGGLLRAQPAPIR
jgi:hypothetical protein